MDASKMVSHPAWFTVLNNRARPSVPNPSRDLCTIVQDTLGKKTSNYNKIQPRDFHENKINKFDACCKRCATQFLMMILK